MDSEDRPLSRLQLKHLFRTGRPTARVKRDQLRAAAAVKEGWSDGLHVLGFQPHAAVARFWRQHEPNRRLDEDGFDPDRFLCPGCYALFEAGKGVGDRTAGWLKADGARTHMARCAPYKTYVKTRDLAKVAEQHSSGADEEVATKAPKRGSVDERGGRPSKRQNRTPAAEEEPRVLSVATLRVFVGEIDSGPEYHAEVRLDPVFLGHTSVTVALGRVEKAEALALQQGAAPKVALRLLEQRGGVDGSLVFALSQYAGNATIPGLDPSFDFAPPFDVVQSVFAVALEQLEFRQAALSLQLLAGQSARFETAALLLEALRKVRRRSRVLEAARGHLTWTTGDTTRLMVDDIAASVAAFALSDILEKVDFEALENFLFCLDMTQHMRLSTLSQIVNLDRLASTITHTRLLETIYTPIQAFLTKFMDSLSGERAYLLVAEMLTLDTREQQSAVFKFLMERGKQEVIESSESALFKVVQVILYKAHCAPDHAISAKVRDLLENDQPWAAEVDGPFLPALLSAQFKGGLPEDTPGLQRRFDKELRAVVSELSSAPRLSFGKLVEQSKSSLSLFCCLAELLSCFSVIAKRHPRAHLM